MEETDDKLISAIAAGDKNAFERVYLENKDELLTVAFWVIGDRQAAEDVTHDVFLSFVKRSAKLPRQSRIRAYLVTSCANKAKDFLRRKRPVRFDDTSVEYTDQTSSEPFDSVVGEEQLAQLSKFISKLPLEQREVLAMRLQGDMVFREIANSISCSINTVQSRYRYAIETLRQMFHDSEKETNSCSNK